MLTAQQSEKIERMQRLILKIIYGTDITYREALDQSGIQRLEERRSDIIRKFAQKTVCNPRYDHWFTRQGKKPHDLRKQNIFYEERTNTEQRKRESVLI